MSANEIRPGTGYTVSIAGETGYGNGLKVVRIEPFAYERAKTAAEARKATEPARGSNGKKAASPKIKSTT